jgi:hypothetical protein
MKPLTFRKQLPNGFFIEESSVASVKTYAPPPPMIPLESRISPECLEAFAVALEDCLK